MTKSKNCSKILREILETQQGSLSDTLKVAHTAVLNALHHSNVDPNPSGDLNLSIRNFSFDPYGLRCNWVQDFGGRECAVELFGLEYQPAQSVEVNLRNYQPGPGLHLLLSYGTSAIGNPGSFKQRGGSKVDAINSKRYVHRETYRGLDTVIYRNLSKMASAAKIKGLMGINFPDDWDEIPYA
jgi:hypothetical protein